MKTHLESLLRLKCVLRNQRSRLSLGTKIDTANDINIQPCIKAQFDGLNLDDSATIDGEPGHDGPETADDSPSLDSSLWWNK